METLQHTKRSSHLASRVAECHRSFRHKVCERNHQWAEAQHSCNVRLCPHDARRRSLRLAARWEKHLTGRKNLRYVVFAERNSQNLVQGLVSLYRAWSHLRSSKLWKAASRGCVVVLEVTYNREHKSWHPHLNVLFEGTYIPFEALKQAWLAATSNNGQTSFIRAADSGTVRELVKYVTKLSDFVDEPEAVDHFLCAVKRKRFIRTYGSFYNLPIEDEDNGAHCPDCDSTCVADVGVAHADQIYIDASGVLRIDRKRLRPSQQPSTEDFNIAWPRAPVERSQQDAAWNELVRRMENR